MRRVMSGEKIILYALIGIFLGLTSFIFFRYQFYESSAAFAQEFYLGIQRSFNPSQARVRLDNKKLVVDFKINPADQTNLAIFLKNFDLDNPDNLNLKIELGDETAGFINKVIEENRLQDNSATSIDLNMRILSKEIEVNNKKIFGPFDSSTEDLLKNSSLEGSIKIQGKGESGYTIEIDNPEQVIYEATTSGKLNVSEKLTGSRWWQLLSGLAKIKLIVDNGSVSGSIILK